MKKRMPNGKQKAIYLIKAKHLNNRVATCLEKLELHGFTSRGGYYVKYFELGFLNMKNRKGSNYVPRVRKRILTEILQGKCKPEYASWVDRLEYFTAAVCKLNKS